MTCLINASRPVVFPDSIASAISSNLTNFSNLTDLAPIPEILNPYSSSPIGMLTNCFFKPVLYSFAFY